MKCDEFQLWITEVVELMNAEAEAQRRQQRK